MTRFEMICRAVFRLPIRIFFALLISVGLIYLPSYGHFIFGKIEGDYNISLEFIRVADDIQDADLTPEFLDEIGMHEGSGEAYLAIGNYLVNVYILRNMTEPVDDASIEVLLTSQGDRIGPISPTNRSPGKYATIYPIRDVGIYDAQVTLNIPSETDPIVTSVPDIEFEPVRGSTPWLLLVVGLVIIAAAVFLIFGPRSKKQAQEG